MPSLQEATRAAEFFQHIRQIEAPWRDGSIRLPIFYYDAMAIEGDFLAATEQVQAHLPSARMHPFRIAPGRCLVSLVALAYRNTDIGPYNEVLIGIPFTLDEPSPLFTGTVHRLPEAPFVYVHRLAVTTEIALHAGIDFLAAPKFLADITFEDAGGRVHCRLAEGGAPILTLVVRKGEGKPVGRSYARMITAESGYLLRWDFIESEQQKHSSRAGSDVQLELGSHAIADELRAMQLGKPLACAYQPQFQAILGPVMESFEA